MAVTAGLTIQLTGSDTFTNSNFSTSYTLALNAQATRQTIEVVIQSSDVARPVPIPAISAQSLLMVTTDNPVSFTVNSEVAIHALNAGGVYLIAGGANTTQLLFTGMGSQMSKVLITAISST